MKPCLLDLTRPQCHELLWIQLPAQDNIPNWSRKEFKAPTLAEEGKSVFSMTWPLAGCPYSSGCLNMSIWVAQIGLGQLLKHSKWT